MAPQMMRSEANLIKDAAMGGDQNEII